MKSYLAVAITGLVCLPVAVAAQTSIEGRSSAAVEVSGSSGRTSARGAGEAAIHHAKASDLPEAPVRRAIQEGRAKGASREEIDARSMAVVSRLELTRKTLDEGARSNRRASHAEIAAGAEAIAAGASRADLSRIRDSAPAERSLEVSLAALAQMRASGASGRDAASQIAARLGSGASDRDIAGLARAESAGRLKGAGGRGAVEGAAGVTGAVGGAAGRAGGALGGAARVGASLGGGLF